MVVPSLGMTAHVGQFSTPTFRETRACHAFSTTRMSSVWHRRSPNFIWHVPRSARHYHLHPTRSKVTRFICTTCCATPKPCRITALTLCQSPHCSATRTTCCCILRRFITTSGREYRFSWTGILAISLCGPIPKPKTHRLNFQHGGITTGFASSRAFLIFTS